MTPDPRPGPAASRRCAVLGSPIAHSLSPALHRAAYAWLGLDWHYDRFQIDEAGLPGFVAGLDDTWRGLSLTMPLKVAALALGEPDDLVRQVGAANTLLLGPEGRQVRNTDVGGLVWAVRRAGVQRAGRVVLLGAGATARSALVSAAELGAEQVTVLARTPAKAAPLRSLGSRLGIRVDLSGWGPRVPEADLVLQTATAGAADSLAEAAAASAPVVFDAIYDPWPTALAEAAARRGAAVVTGLDLLVGQALLQLRLMTGRTVPPEILQAALPHARPGRGDVGGPVGGA